MFRFLKMLLTGAPTSTDLMEKARESAMLHANGNTYSKRSIVYKRNGEIDEERTQSNERIIAKYFQQDRIHHEQQEEMDNLFHQQQLHNPYLNPGQDIVVDESYHGIDHGMDNHNHHHNNF